MALGYSDIEARESMRRLKQIFFSFGMDTGERTDTDVNLDVLMMREFLEVLREREKKRLSYHGKSPQIKHRRGMAQYIMQVCAVERLSRETVYQAIYLSDRFMDTHDIPLEQLIFVAITCIVISGKLLEVDKSSPKFRDIARHIRNGETTDSKTKMLVVLERFVLSAFSFEILIPTEVNFLEVYLLYAIDGLAASENRHTLASSLNDSSTDDNNNVDLKFLSSEIEASSVSVHDVILYSYKAVPNHDMLTDMKWNAFKILEELSIAGVTTVKYSPSLIAAAILLAVRRQVGLNFWTSTLENVTSYTLQQVYECLNKWIHPRLFATGAWPKTPPISVQASFQTHVLEESIKEVAWQLKDVHL